MALVVGHLSRVWQCTHALVMKQGPNLPFPAIYIYIIYINKNRKTGKYGNACGNCVQTLGKQLEQNECLFFFQIDGQCLVLGSLLGSWGCTYVQ